MKIRFHLLIILSCSFIFCRAQFNAGQYYLEGLDKELQYDSLIRSAFNRAMPSSYFVITYPLAGAVTTFGPQFGKAFYEIKQSNAPDVPIFVIFSNKGGIRPQDINLYIKEIFNILPKEINYTINEELYKTVNGEGLLTRLLYFYRGKPIYNSVPKLYDFPGNEIPYEHVQLVKEESIRLSGVDSTLILETDNLLEYNSSNIIIQGDVKDVFHSLDTKSGKVNKLFALSDHLTGIQSYCSLFAGNDTAKCAFAKQYDSLLVARNRQILNVDGIRIEGNKIHGFFGTEAFEKLTEPYSYRDDENKKITIPAGAPSLNAFLGYFEYNMSTNELKLFEVEETKSGKYELYIASNADFHILNDSQILTDVLYYPASENKPILCVLGRRNGTLKVESYLGPKTNKKDSEMIEGAGASTYFFKFNDKLYYCSDVLPSIFRVNEDKAVSQFYGNMTAPYAEETYPVYAEDTIRKKRNFEIRSINTILNQEFLAIYYSFKDRYILEIKDRDLKTVDIIFMDELEGFQDLHKGKFAGFNVLIANNHFYFTGLKEDGEFYLNSYEIKKFRP